MPLLAGTRLGPYEILAPIGEGGMGEVYRAHDSKLDRDVVSSHLCADCVLACNDCAQRQRDINRRSRDGLVAAGVLTGHSTARAVYGKRFLLPKPDSN
jgi:serine/threonine protein kinase